MSDTKIKVTRENFSKALDEVVQGNEGYVYDLRVVDSKMACVYALNGKPSCLIGQVLYRLGVDVTRLEGTEKNYTATANTLLAALSHTFPNAEDVGDAVLREAAHGAQVSQDSGDTWGQARARFYEKLATADKELEEVEDAEVISQ